MGANGNVPLQITQANLRRVRWPPSGASLTVDELVQEVAQGSPFGGSEVSTRCSLVVGNPAPQRAQHPFASGGQRERITPGVAVRVLANDQAGGKGTSHGGADRGTLEPDAPGEHRLTDAGTLGKHRDHSDDSGSDLAVADSAAERRHDPVVGDVKIQPEHRFTAGTELGLNCRCWRRVYGVPRRVAWRGLRDGSPPALQNWQCVDQWGLDAILPCSLLRRTGRRGDRMRPSAPERRRVD